MSRPDRPPSKLAALEQKTAPPRGWSRLMTLLFRPMMLSWMINIGCALVVTMIITHPSGSVLSEWTAVDIAPSDFRVPRDLEIPDEVGTAKKKEEAAAQVQSVYDFDPAVHDRIRKEVDAFFSGLRELYPPTEPETGETVPEASDSIKAPEAFLTERTEELIQNFGYKFTDEDFNLLKGSIFSPEFEQLLLAMLRGVYLRDGNTVNYVVYSRDLLLKDRDRGIMARTVTGKPEDEEENFPITNLDAIIDQTQAGKIVDLMAKDKHPGLSKTAVTLIDRIAHAKIEPNLTFNKDKTEAVRAEAVANVKPLYYKFKRDEIIVRKGDRLKPETMQKIGVILAAEQSDVPSSLRSSGLTLLTVFFTAFIFTFAGRNIKKFHLELKDQLFLAVTAILALGSLRLAAWLIGSAQANINGLPEGINFYYLVPLAGAAMMARMVLNSEIALVFAVVLAAAGGLAADHNLYFSVYTLAGSAAAAGAVGQCRQRSTILRAGLILGIVNALMIVFMSMSAAQIFIPVRPYVDSVTLINAAIGFGSAIVAAIVVTGVVPLVEAVFSYATDIKLLELLNQDHPLMKDLSMKSPGTHQHSLMVANLAEAAAKEVGANPLLARVCAMYHDIGKMDKPLYFAENQWDNHNVHDRLAPSMSTLIIHNHVKEGAELARKFKLPKVVAEAIVQHHGTSLLKFFYEKAKETNDTGVPLEELDFRYPGPKPQTRENAIILLADVVEAASKSVRDLHAHEIKGVVQTLINRAFVDGQLDECDLTLKNLHDIARSFNQTLGAVYHPRPEYPTPVTRAPHPDKRKKAEHDAAKHKDKTPDQTPDDEQTDRDQIDHTLKRLGM
jgi:cyclic-di-AMP phosphodiesterase PgpH